MTDTWIAPYSIKIMNNFLEPKYYGYIDNIIKNRTFYRSNEVVNGKKIVVEENKIRLDYTLTNEECSVIDKPLIIKANCNCNLRERWRLLYYDGDSEKKAFRGPHTDWTCYSCHRRMSIIIGLSNPNEYEGGELIFPNNNLRYKLEKGAAIIFDGRLVHEVLPVTKGKRFVLQAFLFDQSGWNLKKSKINYNSFELLEPEKKNITLDNKKWKIYENLNAAHSKICPYDEHYVGTFTYITDVYTILENNDDDECCFIWFKPEHFNQKWRGRLYLWSKETREMKNRFKINSWPNEKNTITGIKNITDVGSDKTLTLINTDGGPGNQIVGIKEGIIISKILNRKFIFPPIIQHYVLNNENRGSSNNLKYWDFSEIFTFDDELNVDLMKSANYLNNKDQVVYCLRNQDINNELRMEKIVNGCYTKKESIVKKFNDVNDIKKLESIHDTHLVLAHLYNNVRISNCFWNGCDTCPNSLEFKDIYDEVCKKLDFSKKIKKYGDEIINYYFGNEKFISLHIRYSDYGNNNIKKINGLYDEDDIDILLSELLKRQNIKHVFIATNNKNKIMTTKLRKYKILEHKKNYNELESFIEQYICCISDIFIYSGGIHAKPDHTHLRSTWSSFVLDYRYYKLLNKKDIYLSNYFR